LAFKDHFSGHADSYARSRPRYPAKLFSHLATLPAQRERAWDCGTGNGQAAVALAQHFAEVVASDGSARQIEHAEPHARVRYLVAPAEQCPLADRSVDLVTVAQALHWFDLERFYAEVRRVGRPGSVLAAWGYEMAHITPQVDAAVGRLYRDVVGPYWPPERETVERRYETLTFPFRRLDVPPVAMTAQWNLGHLMGYLETWSSVQRYRAQQAADPLDLVRGDLAAAWGRPETVREVSWPLFVLAGRIEQPA
jgi:SAM-dependent methyltransferase